MEQVMTLILAAGEGKRMKSRIPKVLHTLCSVPMLRWVMDATAFDATKPIVVVGHGAQQVMDAIGEDAQYVMQAEQKGTGHAVLMAKALLQKNQGYVLVVAGDMPLLEKELMEKMVAFTMQNELSACVLTSIADDPTGYGRIVREEDKIQRIIEHKDASAAQREIKEINTAIYCFKTQSLLACLDDLKNDNAQGEYYLTDVIELLNRKGESVGAQTADQKNCLGVNDFAQLAHCERLLQARVNRALMLQGVRLMNSESIFISPYAKIQSDVIIYPGNVIEGSAVIQSGTVLFPGNYIEGAIIGENCKIGPNAHLRNKVVLHNCCRVGNFVELKNVTVDDGAKVSHLAYCGDGKIGKKSNISCGVIFSNYDGKNKHFTQVGENAFVGCNVNLVAPVTIEDDAYIAAGSTITKDVKQFELGVARQRQTNIPGWVKRRGEKK